MSRAAAQLIVEICSIANRPFVESVENTFAGYFNELGVTVKFAPDATDADVIALTNELLEFFNAIKDPPEGFTWTVAFTRGGKKLRSLLPGDAPRTSALDLEWTE
jgi:hypothetical protein